MLGGEGRDRGWGRGRAPCSRFPGSGLLRAPALSAQQRGREDAGSWGLAERSLAWLGSSVGSWPGARYSSEPDPGNSGCSDNAIWSSERASGRKPETQLFLKKE